MDFGSISGRGSMKRKQSASLLQALGKGSSVRTSAIPIPPPSSYTPPTATSSHFSHDEPDTPTDTSSTRHTSGSSFIHSARSTSGMSLTSEKDKRGALIRRSDDVFKVVKDRVFSWSYMMQWYQGDIHWFNTVKTSRSALESSLGPSRVDQRARNIYLLGTSLANLFDIGSVGEFLRSLIKLLDEWEAVVEGNKGVMNLFRGQKKKGATSVYDGATGPETDTLLLPLQMPFAPDFFISHSILCDAMRDVYKKILGMILPPAEASRPKPPESLIHPSTIIQSTHVDLLSPSLENPSLSPANDPIGLNTRLPSHDQDAFQLLVAGELADDQALVGEGQKLTPIVIELFTKADAKLKKIYSTMVREGDALARKVLEDELSMLGASMHTGAPLKFNLDAAMSGPGNGLFANEYA